MLNQLIILDRDGVINYDSPEYIKSPDEWHPIPGSLEAIKALNDAGFSIIITTNQSGIGRGYFNCATLDAIHQKMLAAIEKAGGKITKIYYCPHHPDDNCQCRKPKTGMIDQLQKDFEVDISKAFLIGDSWKDVKLGLSIGCQPLLVKTGNGQTVLVEHENHLQNVIVVDDLSQAANWILDNDHIY